MKMGFDFPVWPSPAPLNPFSDGIGDQSFKHPLNLEHYTMFNVVVGCLHFLLLTVYTEPRG